MAVPDEDLQRDDVLGREARIDREQPFEAADEQPGAGQQHQRKRNFGGDQPSAETTARRAALPLAHRVCSGRENCSAGSRPNASAVTVVSAAANSSDPAVDRGLVQTQHAAGASATMPACPSARARRRRRPRCAASMRLSATSCRTSRRAAGAERRADRELPLALHAAREQQARHVGAADDQHEDDRAEHHEERQADVAHQVLAQRDDRCA